MGKVLWTERTCLSAVVNLRKEEQTFMLSKGVEDFQFWTVNGAKNGGETIHEGCQLTVDFHKSPELSYMWQLQKHWDSENCAQDGSQNNWPRNTNWIGSLGLASSRIFWVPLWLMIKLGHYTLETERQSSQWRHSNSSSAKKCRTSISGKKKSWNLYFGTKKG